MEQIDAQLRGADQLSTERTVALLGLQEGFEGKLPETPTLDQIQRTLMRVEEISGDSVPLTEGRGQEAVRPAVLQVRFTQRQGNGVDDKVGSLDLTLVTPRGPVQSRRVEVDREAFAQLLRSLYSQLSRQDSLDIDNPLSPSRQLHALLLSPIDQRLQEQGITTLLIAADQGLQAVPFAALSDGSRYFGTRYAFGLTPSLALTDLNTASSAEGLLALGASEFKDLAPLPLVPQELDRIVVAGNTDRFLNSEFTPQLLVEKAADPRYARLHVATHADFRPGGPARSVLHTGNGPMSMAEFARLRQQRAGVPLDLVVLSACRTLLGDKESELGFAGLALQAGARSAVGTLWYVDDVVTSAFFVQFYRYLEQGVPKAAALQKTRQLFSAGRVTLDGDRVFGEGPSPLLTDLNVAQQRRVAAGVRNPFFWAGIELIGSPW